MRWLLKSTFGKGQRSSFSSMGYWSDGIIGTPDDVVARAGVNPFEDYLAASAEALAARVLKDTDPELAAHSLRTAREDWQAANGAAERGDNAGARGGRIDTVAAGTQASVDLFQATGEAPFEAKAVELCEHSAPVTAEGFSAWTQSAAGRVLLYRPGERAHSALRTPWA